MPRALAQHIARLLLAEHVHLGTRRGRHAVLRWFRDATPVAALARDNAVGISTSHPVRRVAETTEMLSVK